MKKNILLVFLGLSYVCFGQTLSNYKYVMIPNKFEFQKSPNQYNLNKLTQFQLNKYDFESFLEGDSEGLLESIEASKILRLKAIAKGTLATKITLAFLNYRGEVIYTSKEGRSNRKDFKQSYTEAFRNVFKDIEISKHKYVEIDKPLIKNQVPKKSLRDKHSSTGTEVFQLKFELRGKEYNFIPISKNEYSISNGEQVIGKAVLQKNSLDYELEAGTLSGSGKFDDFGNFILTRVNPANKKELTDTLIRVK